MNETVVVYFTNLSRRRTRFFAKSPLTMTWFPVLTVTLIILSLSAKPTSSISIRSPNRNLPAGAGDLLFGDAHYVGDGDAVQLSRKTSSSFGIIFPSTSFNFSSSSSLFSHFTFEIGKGVALVIIPADFPSRFARNMSFDLLTANRFLGIEFYVNVCSISSSRVSNVSKTDNLLKDGVKLSSWIDYHAISNRLEVRVSKLGDSKPVEPLISYHVNLGEILKGEEVLLGLASSNEKQEQISSVYSWSFEIKDVPKWLHSIPVNPQEHSEIKDVPKWLHSIPINPHEHTTVQMNKKDDGLLSGFIFATGFGALLVLIMFFVWSYFVDRRNVHAEASVHPVDFKYEKIVVLEVKNSETAMK